MNERRLAGKTAIVNVASIAGLRPAPGPDIGSVVTFLLSADSVWMTGQTPAVDGGVPLGVAA